MDANDKLRPIIEKVRAADQKIIHHEKTEGKLEDTCSVFDDATPEAETPARSWPELKGGPLADQGIHSLQPTLGPHISPMGTVWVPPPKRGSG